MQSSSNRNVADILPILRKQWERFNVRRAWLFGSRAISAAKGNSDWDFMVEFGEPPGFDAFMGLKTNLEKTLGSPVDVVSRTACTTRFLKAIEPELIDVT